MKLVALLLGLIPPMLIFAGENSAAMKPEDQWEIRADIDGDGVMDRLESEPIRGFGTMGGEWEVFLGRKEGGFTLVGTIYAHPLAIRIERRDNLVRLWVYLKSSGSVGSLGYYTLKGGSISGPQMLEIFPGDGGTDLGRSLHDTIFSPKERLTAFKKEPNKSPDRTPPSGVGQL